MIESESHIIPEERLPVRHSEQKKDRLFSEFYYSAKRRVPTAEFNQLNGRYEYDFTNFGGTPFQVVIPFRGFATIEKAQQELDTLTVDELQAEGMHKFYRHIYMLQHIGDPKFVAKFIPTILYRTKNETGKFLKAAYSDDKWLRKLYKKEFYFTTMACVEKCEEDPGIEFSQNIVRELFDEAKHGDPLYWRYALSFDIRNKKNGTSIDVENQFRELLTVSLLDPKKAGRKYLDTLIEATSSNQEFQENVLIYALLKAKSKKQILSIVDLFAPELGIERIRKHIREYTSDNPAFKPKFDAIFEYMGFDSQNPEIDMVSSLYEKIDFSNYKPNSELLGFEIDLLGSELKGKEKVLDVACGTGRHMEQLDNQNGTHIIGVDIVKKHIDGIKSKNPDADARLASWFDLPLPDESIDAAYCLGRSFAHNTTIPDAVTCLAEIRRVLKDDGCIILDLPDPDVGEYKEDIETTLKIAKERHLKGYLPGMIIDSPDKEHYIDRYIPHPYYFEAIARIAGFRAEKIAEKKYKGVTGIENNNIYWRLKKDDYEQRLYDNASGRFGTKKAYFSNITSRRYNF